MIAPDHELALRLITPERLQIATEYQEQFNSMTGTDRLENMAQKTGIFTGTYALNPLTGKEIPIFLLTMYLRNMVPGSLWAFLATISVTLNLLRQYSLPIIQVVTFSFDAQEGIEKRAYEGDGTLIHSGQFNGLELQTQAKEAFIEYLEKNELGSRKITYKLRDWIFSRQRYWGEPIPLIHCICCGVVPVPEEDLPVELPFVENYKPTGPANHLLRQLKNG